MNDEQEERVELVREEAGVEGEGEVVILHVYDVRLPPTGETAKSKNDMAERQHYLRRVASTGNASTSQMESTTAQSSSSMTSSSDANGGGIGSHINNFVAGFNSFFGGDRLKMMGVFHSGLEVNGEEWGYGYCEHGSGVYRVRPSRNPMYSYRYPVALGKTPLKMKDINKILQDVKSEWQGTHYHLLKNNCNHFCVDLAKRLKVDAKFPIWINRLANFGQGCVTTAEHVYASARMISNEISGCFQMALMSSTTVPQQMIRDRVSSRTENLQLDHHGNHCSNSIEGDSLLSSVRTTVITSRKLDNGVGEGNDNNESLIVQSPSCGAMSRTSTFGERIAANDNVGNVDDEARGENAEPQSLLSSQRNQFIHFPSIQEDDGEH